jgi:streptogramin lyase
MATRTALILLALGLGVQAASVGPGSFSVYYMPTAVAGPCDITTGPDGNIWVQDQLVNKLARIDVTTGLVTEYEIPFTLPGSGITLPNVGGRAVLACAVQPGADGHLYASNGIRNQLVQVNTTTGHVKVLTPQPYDPLGNGQPFNDLYTSPDGMFFTQSTANIISFYDFAKGTFKSWTIPTIGAGPLGIFYASDGAAWFCEFTGQKIGRLDPQTGTFKEYPVPLSLLAPAVMRAETEGRYLWFTAAVGNSIGRIDITNGEMMAYPNDSPLSVPGVDTKDGQGNIWFSTFNTDELNKLDPRTGKVSHVPMPNTLIPAPLGVPYDLSISVTYGPDNAIWFTNDLADRVGRYQL